MKTILQRMPIWDKRVIDNKFLTELVDINRQIAYSEGYKDQIMRVLALDDKLFVDLLIEFWNFHNKFNNEIIDPMLYKDEYSSDELQVLRDLFQLSNDIDMDLLPLSASLKDKAGYLSNKLKDIYQDDKEQDLIPQKGSFFTKNKRDHLFLIWLQKKQHPKYNLYLKKIIQEYHSGDKELFSIRYAKSFQSYEESSLEEIDGILADMDAKKREGRSTLKNDDYRHLDKIIEFDNLTEYKYISQLQGLPAFKLRYVLLEQLEKEGLLQESEKLNDVEIMERTKILIESKNNKVKFNVQPYQQTGLTCSAACLLMMLNYFNNEPFSQQLEKNIAEASNSEFIEGQHYSGVGLEALNHGLKAKLIHSSPNLFDNHGGIGAGLFNMLMHEYETFLEKFIENGGMMDIDDLGSSYLCEELRQGNIVMLAGYEGSMLHSVLLTGFDNDKGQFSVIDPLKGYTSVISYEDIKEFCSTGIGRRALSVGKVNIDEIKEEIQKAREIHKKLHNTFDVNYNTIDLSNLAYHNYNNFGRKGYNLSVLKKYGFDVAEGIVLDANFLDRIIKDKLMPLEEEEFLLSLKNQLGEDLIVRSNFIGEDGDVKSFAGVFSSFTSVPINEVIEKIRQVSKSSKDSKTYSQEEVKAGVLIQKMIYGDYSGVAFSKNPLTGKDGLIELVEGLNEHLVSGEKNPYSLTIKNGEINKISELNIKDQLLDDLSTKLSMIKDIFGKDVDVEFTMAGDRVYILQVRYITTANYDETIKKVSNNLEIDNIQSISKGDFEGDILYIEKREDIQKINKKGIIVCESLYPDLLSKAEFIKGVVSEKGGLLAHFAIIGRELKIPILSNAEGILEKIKKSDYIKCSYSENNLLFS